MHRVGANGGDALVQHVVVELLVGVDTVEPRQGRNRQQLRRRRERRDHGEVVELHDAGARVQNAGRDRILRRLRFIEVDDVDRRVAGHGVGGRRGMVGSRDRAAPVARHDGKQRACRDEPPLHGVLGCQG